MSPPSSGSDNEDMTPQARAADLESQRLLASEGRSEEVRRGTMDAKGNPWAFVTLSYLNSMMSTTFKRPLEPTDIPLLKEKDRGESISQDLRPFNAAVHVHVRERKLAEEAKQAGLPAPKVRRPPSLLMHILNCYGHYVTNGLLFRAIDVATMIYSPFVLKALILYLSKDETAPDGWTPPVPFRDNGYALAIMIFLTSTIGTTASACQLQLLRNFRFISVASVKMAIFEKFMKVWNKANKEYTEARILSMVNMDSEQLSNGFLMVPNLVIQPIQLFLIVFFLIHMLGTAVLPAAFVLVVCFVAMIPVGKLIQASAKSYMTSEDKRIKKVRELLMSIRWVKLAAEEAIREREVGVVREEQLKAIWGFNSAFLWMVALGYLPSLLMIIASFLLYARNNGGSVDPAIIFPALLLFNQLKTPMQTLPEAISSLLNSRVAMNRINAFLLSEEREPRTFTTPEDDRAGAAIVIQNASFKWEASPAADDTKKKAAAAEVAMAGKKDEKAAAKMDDKAVTSDATLAEDTEERKEEKPFFEDLNLKILKGKLTAVVGTVGSGKSSLLSAVLGDMTLVSGFARAPRHIAYCSQQTWLLSASIRQNILFGTPEDPARLAAAVRASGLEKDIDGFQSGLETQVGEKGVILSGGQKSRVALARAVYADADAYLLDDPVAALDAEVGNFVLRECVAGALNGKTRVLVTHRLEALDFADWVVVMEKGKVVEEGPVSVLLGRNGKLTELVADYERSDPSKIAGSSRTEAVEPKSSTSAESIPAAPKKANADGETTPLLTGDKSSIPKKKGVFGGVVVEEDRERGGMKFEVFVEYWRLAGGKPIIAACIVSFVGLTFVIMANQVWLVLWSDRSFGLPSEVYLITYACIGLANVVLVLLSSFVLATAGYRAGKRLHQGALSGLLRAPMSFFDSQPIGRILNRMSKILVIADLVASICVLVSTKPLVSILVFLMGLLSRYLLEIYRNASREMKRIVSTEKSPLNAHISESLSGVVSLRAFGAESRMVSELKELLDRSNGPNLAHLNVKIWLETRIQFFAALIVLFISLSGVVSTNSASAIAVAIMLAISLKDRMAGMIMILTMLETEMVSVERVLQYANNLPQEAERRQPNDPAPTVWPGPGQIDVKNLEVRYNVEDDPVLKNLNLSIRPGEKIGIVGRTGSGKSTFLTALFRIVEPTSGTIYIDGEDITKLGLWTLRERLQIIPQEPVLFTGTIRSNVDPRNRFEDAKVWDALEMVGLKEYVSSKDQKLDHAVEEGGANLSVGQRQLLILARALCVRPKILVMDEASSAVDAAADSLIQSSIKKHFATVTVLSIVHRLNTIADFDRVVVLDDGNLVEFDTPAQLLRKSRGVGYFRRLVDATGASNAAVIERIALEQEKGEGKEEGKECLRDDGPVTLNGDEGRCFNENGAQIHSTAMRFSWTEKPLAERAYTGERGRDGEAQHLEHCRMPPPKSDSGSDQEDAAQQPRGVDLEAQPLLASEERNTDDDRGVMDTHGNPFTFITLSYLNKMMVTSLKRPLEPTVCCIPSDITKNYSSSHFTIRFIDRFQQDVPLLKESDRAESLSNALRPFNASVQAYIAERRLAEEAKEAGLPAPKPRRSPRLHLHIFSCYGHYFAFGLFFKFVQLVAMIYSPFVLRALIEYLTKDRKEPDPWTPPVPFKENGYALALLIFLTSAVGIVAGACQLQLLRNFRFNMIGTVKMAIFEKVLKVSNKASKEFTEGRILSMVNMDSEQLSNGFMMLPNLLIQPVQLFLIVFFLIRLIGTAIVPAALVLLGCLIAMIPVGALLQASAKKYTTTEDRRIKKIREVFMSIRWVKLAAEEAVREREINVVREEQLKAVWGFNSAILWMVVIGLLPPVLMVIASVLIYAKNNGGSVDPAVIFPAFLLFDELIGPMQILPQAISSLINTIVSANRINSFLVCDERESRDFITTDDDSAGAAVVIENATFKWEAAPPSDEDSKKSAASDKDAAKEAKAAASAEPAATVDGDQQSSDDKPFFEDLTLKIPKGKLTAVVGPVGSGKSSLLSAILGDMTLVSGTARGPRHIAYCSQQTWLLSATIRQNILFGTPEDPARLAAAVRASGLEKDIDGFQSGLETQVGEKGVILSGGQKARVALARAVYADADAYLLDDPVAALDAEVGNFVLRECVAGALNGKTRVLVTHRLEALDFADWVVVMDKGKVVEEGPVATQLGRDGKLAELLAEYKRSDPTAIASTSKLDEAEPTASTSAEIVPAQKPKVEDDETTPLLSADKSKSKKKGVVGGIIAEEDRERGGVKFEVFAEYWRRAGGKPVVAAFITSFIALTATVVSNQVWLVLWSDRAFGLPGYVYLYTYFGIGMVNVAVILFASFVLATSGYRAGKSLHEAALAGLLRAPMSFFDSQPIGRILNRMGQDIGSSERYIWVLYINTILILANILASICVLIATNPLVSLLILLMGLLFRYLLDIYRSASREMQRIVSTERSPLNAHISESLTGVSCLRAFSAESRMVSELKVLLDRSSGPTLAQMNVKIWLDTRMQFFTAIIVLFISLSGVASTNSASAIAMAITLAVGLKESMATIIMVFTNLETEMVAVERVIQYANNLPTEAERRQPSDPVPAVWPGSGQIEVKDLEVRYNVEDDPVLKNLNLSIRPGEKVGIVGRTGSGKSTFLTALFRIVEPTSGTIYIDGEDITKLGLWTLRERLQIIPQEPVLFTGTIRSNVDPRNRFEDAKVWDALEMVGLKEYVSSKDQKLDHVVEEGGTNLSVGQRQLLILARALCVRPKILVMDEASSAVDAAADSLIQASIKKHFSTATVLSIAHRLNTIADFDRVAVLDDGTLAEFDTPAQLLRKSPEAGFFRRLVDATGASNAAVIERMALEHEEEVKGDC
ncbi:Multidrug resistance-associated protein 1 [Phlyctochytrium bullatum]|nr:Multidrug resistance-associated protein 1 [Phlyctochytrium bullatum]